MTHTKPNTNKNINPSLTFFSLPWKTMMRLASFACLMACLLLVSASTTTPTVTNSSISTASSNETANVTESTSTAIPTTTTTTPTTTTTTTTTDPCPPSMCASDTVALCHRASNTSFGCLEQAECEKVPLSTLIRGSCDACPIGQSLNLENNCVLQPKIYQKREVDQTFGDDTGSSPVSLTLQANHVLYNVWDGVNAEHVSEDLGVALGSLEDALQQAQSGVNDRATAITTPTALEVEAELSSISNLDGQRNSNLKSEYSQQLSQLEPKLVPVSSFQSLETELGTKASAASLQDVVNALNDTIDLANVYTESQMKAAVTSIEQDTSTVFGSVEALAATKSREAQLRTTVDEFWDTDDVMEKRDVNNLETPITTGVNAAADRSDVMSKADLQALAAAAETALAPLTNLVSGECDAAIMAKMRYHVDKDRMEVCVPGKLGHHWRPVGSIPDCIDVDRDGVCLECVEGMVISHGQCVVPAEVYHVDLDGDLLDKAAHGSTSATAVNMVKVGEDGGFITTGPWGRKAVSLNGVDQEISFPGTQVGGTWGVCMFVRYGALNSNSKFFSATPSSATTDVIYLGNKGTTRNLMYRFNDEGSQHILTNGLSWAQGYWTHICATVATNRVGRIYRDGIEVDSKSSQVLASSITRGNINLGDSPYSSANKHFKGDMADFRFWHRTISPAEVVADMCRDKDPLDCVGLVGHFVLGSDGLPKDISHNGWSITPSQTYPFNSQVPPRVRGGPNVLAFDGNDDRYDLGVRPIVGEFSFCAWVSRFGSKTWSRVFGFGIGTDGGRDRIEFGQSSNTETGFFSVNSNGATGRTVSVSNFWAHSVGSGYIHVCAVASKTSLRLYKNGIQAGTTTASLPRYVARPRMYLGESAWNPADQNFYGAMDDIRFYNYALSTNNVKELLCRGKPEVDCIGLLGHWTFEQDTMDVSGAGWHGAVRNPGRHASAQDLFSSDAKQGGHSLRLKNVGSTKGDDGMYMDLGAKSFEGAFSYCAWVKFESFLSYTRLFSLGSGTPGRNIMLYNYRNSKEGRMEVFDNSNRGNRLSVPNFFLDADKKWMHVCATVATDGTMTLYKNGAKAADKTDGLRASGLSTRNVYLGRSQWSDNFFDGYMDDVRMYNRVLSLADVKAIYEQND
eukprot:m.122795 g.122795  ORF g.122795 m.122795 type:complete len:1136 (+) comp15659_c0_seq1:11-3418(+)